MSYGLISARSSFPCLFCDAFSDSLQIYFEDISGNFRSLALIEEGCLKYKRLVELGLEKKPNLWADRKGSVYKPIFSIYIINIIPPSLNIIQRVG